MPYALRQHNINTFDGTGSFTQTPYTIAYSSAVIANDLLLVLVVSFKWQVDSVADTIGNTFTQVKSTTQGGSFPDYADIWCAVSKASGSNTVTPHFTNFDGSNHISTCSVSEWSGNATSSPSDATSGNFGSGTSVDPGSLTPSVNGCLVVSVATDFNGTLNATVTNQTGYTTIDRNLTDNVATMRFYSEYLIQTTKSATDPLFTLGSSSAWEVSGAAFKPGNFHFLTLVGAGT